MGLTTNTPEKHRLYTNSNCTKAAPSFCFSFCRSCSCFPLFCFHFPSRKGQFVVMGQCQVRSVWNGHGPPASGPNRLFFMQRWPPHPGSGNGGMAYPSGSHFETATMTCCETSSILAAARMDSLGAEDQAASLGLLFSVKEWWCQTSVSRFPTHWIEYEAAVNGATVSWGTEKTKWPQGVLNGDRH